MEAQNEVSNNDINKIKNSNLYCFFFFSSSLVLLDIISPPPNIKLKGSCCNKLV